MKTLSTHLRDSSINSQRKPLELWGGIECTVNRVRDRYFSQLIFNGHAKRLDDLDRIADLGLKTLRYPLLWEHVAPDSPDQCDWRWSDQRIHRLAQLGIDPIVGFLHHGSGPRYTHLADSAFAEKFAAYAGKVAARYPWIERYTPINEPLTTARFSGLYGLWYPHSRSDVMFLRMLINQCRGTILAMQEIRKVQPTAQLVLTEDLGETKSTPELAYQSRFENDRRWLSMDLLMGRVRSAHPLWKWLRASGIRHEELAFFWENACPPDLLGINHYVTSNRYLDEDLSRYPSFSHGGNKRHSYADVEMVRVGHVAYTERINLLRQVWQRYHRPIAITEAYLHGDREEQLRWLSEGWQEAQQLRSEGIDIRAVTAWNLLGSYDWSSLLTRCEGLYEPGAFDLRSVPPRKTALASMITGLATEGKFHHPSLQEQGWWKRSIRSLYPGPSVLPIVHAPAQGKRSVKPLLITGARGTLGQAFIRLCQARALPYRAVTREEVELSDLSSVRQALMHIRPWAVINAAGYVRVDDAEENVTACRRDNVDASAQLAAVCADEGLPMLTLSSDLVFDGRSHKPYVESSQPVPLNVYGQSKYDAELRVRSLWPKALIIRTSAFFGPWDEHNFATQTLQKVARGEKVTAPEDVWISPTYVPNLVNTALDLLIDEEQGTWHLSNSTSLTWAAFARRIVREAGLNPTLVEGCSSEEMGWKASRPRNSALESERGQLMLSFDHVLAQYIAEYKQKVLI